MFLLVIIFLFAQFPITVFAEDGGESQGSLVLEPQRDEERSGTEDSEPEAAGETVDTDSDDQGTSTPAETPVDMDPTEQEANPDLQGGGSPSQDLENGDRPGTSTPTLKSPRTDLADGGGMLVLQGEGIQFEGTGTAEDPYLIKTAEDLKTMAGLVNSGDPEYTSAHYRLENDIDLSSVYADDDEGGKGWKPIDLIVKPSRGILTATTRRLPD